MAPINGEIAKGLRETRSVAPPRCAIYIRVSTAEQRIDGWSLQAQEAGLRALAESKGWKVIGVFADEGKSARKRLKGRKAIFQLLDAVKAGEVDVVLFKELDRWMRNMSDFYRVQDVLDAHGVEWYSQQQPHLEMRTKEGRLQVNVLLSFGQNETDTTSDRILYTNKYLRQQKRWTAGTANLPRCYTLDDNQRVIIDPERAPFVRALIDRFLQSGSVRKALIETNEEFGESFHYNNAATLLRNPMLCGDYKEVTGFVEEPLMTREEFDHMQRLMRKNAASGNRYPYIFSGMIRCAGCGRIMTGTGGPRNGKKDYWYYRCHNANINGLCRNSKSINEERLERELMSFVREAVAEQIVTVKAVKQKRSRKPRRSNRASIEKQLDKLEDLYITSDRMTKEKYEEKRQAILAKLVEDEPEEKLPELADLEKIQALFDSGVENLYQSFTLEERRQFWRGVLDSVTIDAGRITAVEFIE